MQDKTSLKFSDRFQRAIKHRSIKLKDIATKCGVSAGYISDIKSGKKQNPSLEMMKKFSEILQCDYEWLLNGDGEMYEGQLQQQAFTKGVELRKAAIEAGLESEIEAMAEQYKNYLYQFPSINSRVREMFKKNIADNISQFEKWCDEVKPSKD